MLDALSAHQALRNAGVRLTAQRLGVVEALVGDTTHPTVEQIYDRVRATYPTISLATVYQTVALLARQGLIRELRASKDGLRCDPELAPHAHACCRQCGAIIDLPLAQQPSWRADELAAFAPERLEVTLYGLCAACRISSS